VPWEQDVADSPSAHRPSTNELGFYTINNGVSRASGWWYAFQVLPDYFGDPNPSDWSVSEQVTRTGSYTEYNSATGATTVVPVNYSGPAQIDPGFTSQGQVGQAGFFNLIDLPGLQMYPARVGTAINGDISVVAASITWSWTVTANHLGKVKGSCTTSFSLTLTIQAGSPPSFGGSVN